MRQRAATPGSDSRRRMRGQIFLVLSSLAIALVGLAMAVDVLSARALLTETGLESALPVVGQLRAAMEHEGAQVVEFACALVGLGLMIWATWRAWHWAATDDQSREH
jgi:hypothetical protein